MSDGAAPIEADVTESAPITTEPAPPAEPDKDWKAEAEKWKSLARKHEDNAKSVLSKAKQFDEYAESQKTEQQKLADAAALAKADADAAKAELAIERAARRHGLKDEDLDLLGTHGTPEEIEQRAARLAARLKAAAPATDFGGGNRGSDTKKAPQLSRDDLKRMTPDAIVKAQADGRLNDLMGIR
jgi:hypothetical protein